MRRMREGKFQNHDFTTIGKFKEDKSYIDKDLSPVNVVLYIRLEQASRLNSEDCGLCCTSVHREK